jgi:hypothetical protein
MMFSPAKIKRRELGMLNIFVDLISSHGGARPSWLGALGSEQLNWGLQIYA